MTSPRGASTRLVAVPVKKTTLRSPVFSSPGGILVSACRRILQLSMISDLERAHHQAGTHIAIFVDRQAEVHLGVCGIVATARNTLAVDRGLMQVADRCLSGNEVTEGMLNRMEGIIRSFEPCLSCATQADGSMGLVVDLMDAEGHLIRRVGSGY